MLFGLYFPELPPASNSAGAWHVRNVFVRLASIVTVQTRHTSLVVSFSFSRSGPQVPQYPHTGVRAFDPPSCARLESARTFGWIPRRLHFRRTACCYSFCSRVFIFSLTCHLNCHFVEVVAGPWCATASALADVFSMSVVYKNSR